MSNKNEVLFEINELIYKITRIDLIKQDKMQVNFFELELNLKPYQVAMILFSCSTLFGVDLYNKVYLDDLSLHKICSIIVSFVNET